MSRIEKEIQRLGYKYSSALIEVDVLNWWTIWQLSKIEHEKNLKNAEMHRRYQQERADQNRPNPFVYVILDHLGKFLVASGLFLQRRFGTLAK